MNSVWFQDLSRKKVKRSRERSNMTAGTSRTKEKKAINELSKGKIPTDREGLRGKW